MSFRRDISPLFSLSDIFRCRCHADSASSAMPIASHAGYAAASDDYYIAASMIRRRRFEAA
jgi:hypothetical protein